MARVPGADRLAAANAVGTHLALVGYMGAGKTTIGREVSRRLGRPFVDLDARVEEETGVSIQEIFDRDGEGAFRHLEAELFAAVVARAEPAVIALGGGAPGTASVRDGLARCRTVWIEVDADTAWERARHGPRPLARDEDEFRARYESRLGVYEGVADARARDVDDVLLAAAGVHVQPGAIDALGEHVPGTSAALVTEPRVAGIHGAAAQVALGLRLASTHEVPTGEDAKHPATLERLWHELALDRGGTLVALGGGCVTDVAGFAAATYLRGIDWVPVPTTLVGQVDAAIGGKTAIDLTAGKNLAGAFHWPVRTVVDPDLLTTLPERERREGLSEVVKTGLLADRPLWELPEPELVRRCAAYKSALCVRDPHDRAERAFLNLGHTFAHALEAGASYDGITHGAAVALGLLAALRLSGRPTDVVEELLAPEPARVDRERAWAALRRDKKARDGRLNLVLLGAEGPYVDAVPAEDVRRALDELVAG